MPICKGARIKIKRANKHIAELEACIDRLRERLTVTSHVDTNSGCEHIKCGLAGIEESDVLEEISAIIGDAIHNLKSALDHVWVETVKRLIPSGKWDQTTFPTHRTRDELKDKLRNLGIDASSPYFFRFIVGQIKPYDAGDWAIRTVHKLDRRDKHRLLIPVIHYSSIGDIYVEDQHGVIHRGDTWSTVHLPSYVNFERGLHIKDPGRASFTIMFQDGDAGTETRAPDTLTFYSAHIAMVVESFEKFTEAWGR